jgi:hypothetical protein
MEPTPTQPVVPIGPEPPPSGGEADVPFGADRARTLFPWWIWTIGASLGLAVIAVIWAAIFFAPLPSLPADAVPPLFTVYPPPSFTPIPPTITPTSFTTPTIPLPTVAPGTIGVGVVVEVTGTGGAGLNLREAPNKSAKVLYRAMEHEVFSVVGGPRQGDGETWWQLQGVYDTSHEGWAVETYLRPVSS